MKGKPRVKLPDQIKAGEIIEVKALVRHPMERGHRKDRDGNPIARNIIHTFKAEYDGAEVFRAEFGTGVASNPFISFRMRAARAGTLVLTWIDDDGLVITSEQTLSVIS